MLSHNPCIGDPHWCLCFCDNKAPHLSVPESVYIPKVAVTAKNAESFSNMVGNQNEVLGAMKNGGVWTLVEFVVITG